MHPILKMIIRTHKRYTHGLNDVAFKGDKVKFLQIENVTPIMKEAYQARMQGDNEHSFGKSFEKIATVPSIVFVEHPEFLQDNKALIKWLKNSNPEGGKCYRTSTRAI